MGNRLALAILVLHGSWAVGAPLPVSAPLAGPKNMSQPEAIFATQLLTVCKQVSTQYVRPIDHRELVYAAMAGLYEAARRPVPSRLKEEVGSTKAAALSLASAMAQTGGLAYPWQASWLAETTVRAAEGEQELLLLLCRLRAELGNPESLQGRQVLVVCCQALAKALDPHSGVVTAEEQCKILGLEQEGAGVGLEVADHLGGTFLRVLAVYPGSPAQRAGLRPEDRITHLDGQPVRRLSEKQVLEMLNPTMGGLTLDGAGACPPPGGGWGGPVGPVPQPQARPLRVTFLRPGRPGVTRESQGTPTSASGALGRAGPTSLRLVPQRYEVEHVLGVQREEDQSWCYWMDARNKLAHVRLAKLGRGSAGQLYETLQRLREEGLRGLVLDLRWCPGGYLTEAVDVARLFLKEGEIARVRGRDPTTDRPPDVCQQPGPFLQTPLIVLVNSETSGGAELVAAALQDHKRALVCGQRTVGKGSVQEQLHLAVNHAGMKLTAGFLIRPSGKTLHRFPESAACAPADRSACASDNDDWGVRPERELELPVSTDFSKALRQVWLLQSLRPGGSTERLPLDDPSWDPQREVALNALRELTRARNSELGVRN